MMMMMVMMDNTIVRQFCAFSVSPLLSCPFLDVILFYLIAI